MNIALPSNFQIALILTIIAGFSTLLGGAITFIVNKNNLRILSLGLGFSAGVMIFLSFTEILDTARESLSTVYPNNFEWITIISFVAGIILAIAIDYFIPDHIESDLIAPKAHHHNKNSDEKENYIDESQCPEEKPQCKHVIKRAGIFTAVAVALHNFPEGMTTFFVTTQNIAIGASIALAIGIHNIPEGISIALPLYHATGKKRIAMLYTFIASIAEPIGALLCLFIFHLFIPEIFIGVLCAIVAGIMIYISFDTLLPLSREYGEWHMSITGVILGVIIIWTSLLLLG